MKITKILSVLFLIQIVTTTSLMAAPTISLTDGGYQAGSGGEFHAVIGGGGATGIADGYIFDTFCLERNESLSLSGTPFYFEVNTEAVQGGLGGPSPDPLDPRTAWLYNQFVDQTLAGYDFDNSDGERLTDAGLLQNAIWALEGELGTPSGNEFYDAADLSGATGIGDVRVLNLYTNSDLTGYAQDVLVKTTPPAVPAPGALLLSAIGTTCVGYFRRRRAA